MRVLITGASGQLGRELQATAPAAMKVVPLAHSELDLRDRPAVEATLGEHSPEVVINTAAYTAVDRAEAESELAFAINATAAGGLAALTAERGGRLIHLSTDFVFAGDRPRAWQPDDETAPLSVYGRSKLQGERAVLEATSGGALVIRTAWLYSRFGSNFVKSVLSTMRTEERVKVVVDQIGSPTWARGLAEALWRACELPDLSGVIHLTDAGVASRFDLAVAVLEEALGLGLLARPAAIEPVPSSGFASQARRPAFGVLACDASWRALNLEPHHWRTALHRMMVELESHGDE